MPSIDIYAIFKDIIAFFKRRNPKLSVLKYIAATDNDPAALAITNMSDFPITIIDFGFDHAGVFVSVNAPFVQCKRTRVEFPQTIEPRTTIDLRIAPGAVDFWEADDCYFVDASGRRFRIEVKFNPSAAR